MDVGSWLEAYPKAWEDRDADAAAALFDEPPTRTCPSSPPPQMVPDHLMDLTRGGEVLVCRRPSYPGLVGDLGRDIDDCRRPVWST
jgi:hypothetical protein